MISLDAGYWPDRPDYSSGRMDCTIGKLVYE